MSDLGDMLRGARERRNVALLDVAAETRIKPAYLEALETGEYSVLPGAAYTAGFLRTYANYLGLHSDDIVQDYHLRCPAPPTNVRPATRVLANGDDRRHRNRFLWGLGVLFLVLGGSFVIRQYNDTTAHAYSSQLSVTPANLGGGLSVSEAQAKLQPKPELRLALRALRPVWVRVTVDGHRAYDGILHQRGGQVWRAHHSIYVVTLDGPYLRVLFDGKHVGKVSHKPGLVVDEGSPHGWQHVS